MTDYKELISNLKFDAEHPYLWVDKQPKDIKDAADAIEQLVTDIDVARKERDAAIADLKGIVADSEIDIDPCYYCKYVEEDGQCFHDCNPFSEKWGWEWRGVPDEIN